MINLTPSRVNAVCCGKAFDVAHYCRDVPREKLDTGNEGVCHSSICMDGKPINGFYCGKGSCNLFGCGCNGGCINNDLDTMDEAIRLFVNRFYVKLYD